MKRFGNHSSRPVPRPLLRRVLLVVPALALLAASCADDAEPDSTRTTRPSDTASDPDVVTSTPSSKASSHRDIAYDGEAVRNPTSGAPQSKLWFHDGSWWGVLLHQASGEFRVHWLEWATQTWHDTGTLVDERPSSRADVLWDGSHLIVASAGGGTRPRQAARVLRFSYDPAARRWTRDPDFPVTLSPAGVSEVSVVRDGAGVLWASYVQDRRVRIARSQTGDAQWGDAYVLPPGADVAAEQAAMASYGGKVGVMWANSVDDAVRFATHDDGAPDDAWQATRTEVRGFASTKNDLALQVLPGEAGKDPLVFAAAKSAPEDAATANKLGPQLLVLSLQADATWKQHVAGQIRDEHAQPLLAVDREQRLLYVFATFPAAGGSINYKVARADRIAFPVGVGTPLVAAESDAALIDHATSTRQPADRSARAVSGPSGADLQACRFFAPVRSGDVSVEVDVRLDVAAAGGAVLTSVRGDQEVANIRLGSNGRFGYASGVERPATELRAANGAWYRSTVVVHLDRKTYDWQLRDRSTGLVLQTVAGAAWVDATSTMVERVCVKSPEGPGASLLFDNLKVRR